MVSSLSKTTIGRAEIVSFPELGINNVHARIDTGARTSAIWVSKAEVKEGRLEVVFFGKEHPKYTGKAFYFNEFTRGMVASSNGQAELRYKIKLLISVGGKNIRAKMTLADRSAQVYKVLVGRNILREKFIVDVKLGTPLKKAEQERSQELQSYLKKDAL